MSHKKGAAAGTISYGQQILALGLSIVKRFIVVVWEQLSLHHSEYHHSQMTEKGWWPSCLTHAHEWKTRMQKPQLN